MATYTENPKEYIGKPLNINKEETLITMFPGCTF